MMQHVFGLFLVQFSFQMLEAISPASLLEKSTGLESVVESVTERKGQGFCVSLSECAAKNWQIAWRSGGGHGAREWYQRRRSLNTHVMLGYADSAGKLHHAWWFQTPSHWAQGWHPYNTYGARYPDIEVTNAIDGRTFIGELMTSSHSHSVLSMADNTGGCECSNNQQIGGRICLRNTVPSNRLHWECRNANYRVPDTIDFPYIRGWRTTPGGSSCGTSGLSHEPWHGGSDLCALYGPTSVVILTGPKPPDPTPAPTAPPTLYPTVAPSPGSPLCSTLTTCGNAGWKQAWRSDDSKAWSTPLETHVMLGYVDAFVQLHHAWYFQTPPSWRNTHPYDLTYDTVQKTVTRAADGKTYQGELVSSKLNYHGACECPQGHGGTWGRVCLRKPSPSHGASWRCGIWQSRVPVDIDFPYLRGFNLGNGCGHSSLSHYDWNQGPTLCSQYQQSTYGRESAIIMTGTFS